MSSPWELAFVMLWNWGPGTLPDIPPQYVFSTHPHAPSQLYPLNIALSRPSSKHIRPIHFLNSPSRYTPPTHPFLPHTHPFNTPPTLSQYEGCRDASRPDWNDGLLQNHRGWAIHRYQHTPSARAYNTSCPSVSHPLITHWNDGLLQNHRG